MDYTILRGTNHPNMGQLGRIQSRTAKTIWRNRRQGRSKNPAKEYETRQTIVQRILERIAPRGQRGRIGQLNSRRTTPGGMIVELQNAWGASSKEYEGLEALAQWAIKKETKLATVRHIQGSPPTKNTQWETTTPRNPDGTYRPTNNRNQNYGDPIELYATRKRPRFNISSEEFQRRIPEQLCLKCVQRGHLARNCPKRMDPKHLTHKPETGNQGRKPPRGKPDRRSEKSRSNRNPNSRETMTVPSKTWSEGQTRTKTLYPGKLVRGTQLHRYT